MKRILINATHEEELRVAMIDGQRLIWILLFRQENRKKAIFIRVKSPELNPVWKRSLLTMALNVRVSFH